MESEIPDRGDARAASQDGRKRGEEPRRPRGQRRSRPGAGAKLHGKRPAGDDPALMMLEANTRGQTRPPTDSNTVEERNVVGQCCCRNVAPFHRTHKKEERSGGKGCGSTV